MSVIKPRTRGKHFIELRTRLDVENHEVLYAYAAFLDEPLEYVINQVVETVLARDREFLAWRTSHPASYAPPRPAKDARSRTEPVPSAHRTEASPTGQDGPVATLWKR